MPAPDDASYSRRYIFAASGNWYPPGIAHSSASPGKTNGAIDTAPPAELRASRLTATSSNGAEMASSN